MKISIVILFTGILTCLLLWKSNFVFAQNTISPNPSVPPTNFSGVNSNSSIIDNENIINQLQDKSTCGKIGATCCTNTFNFESVSLKKPTEGPLANFIVDGIIDTFNQQLKQILSYSFDAFLKPILSQVIPTHSCNVGIPSSNDNACMCYPKETYNFALLCKKIEKPDEYSACVSCSARGVWTALGCVDYNLKDFIQNTVFTLGIGIAGAVSFICIIYSAIALQISRGNPEKIKKAQETLTSCILGLLLIIFSVFILKLIGVGILHLPWFG